MPRVDITRRQFATTIWIVLVMPLLSCALSPVGPVSGQNAMQITLERSGGFTGIPLTIKVDTATLTPDQESQLRHLVEAADFFHLPAPKSIPAQPDRYEYEVTIQEGDRTHTITIGEASIPEPLKPLLHWLMETAQQH